MNYAQHVSTKVTPQHNPVFGHQQVKNNAGGFVFKVDDFVQLDRFLILGNENGTYYASEKTLTIENAKCVLKCASSNLDKTLEHIVRGVKNAPKKNSPVFFNAR